MDKRSGTPFYTILTDKGQDIGRYCTSLTYEDCADVEDILKLSFRSVGYALIENPALQVGRLLRFQFGYYNGACSPVIVMEITSNEPSFSSFTDFNLQATSSGYTLRRDTFDTNWSGKNATQIVKAIAQRNGLKAVVNAPNNPIAELQQGNKNDWDLLKDLAETLIGGPYRYLVKNGTLYFSKSPQSTKPSLVLALGPNGQLESFVPKANNLTKKSSSRKLTASNIDPKTGKETTVQADDSTDNQARAGSGVWVGNAAGKIISKTSATVKEAVQKVSPGNGQIVNLPEGSKSQMQTQLDNRKAKEGENEITATAKLGIGTPNIYPENNYTIRGVGSIWGGNWYCSKVTHKLQWGGAYTTEIAFKRNALNRAQAVNAKQGTVSNATQANAVPGTTKVKVFKYNANGKQV